MKTYFPGICWLILLVLLWAALAACGLFKKSSKKDYSRHQSETVDRSVIVSSRTDNSGLKEHTILELDIRIPKTDKGESEAVPDSAINTISEAITAAIGKATRLTAKVSSLSEGSQQTAENRQENRNYSNISDSISESRDLLKDSNTSMIANVPWYAWVLSIIGMLGLIYYLMNRYTIL